MALIRVCRWILTFLLPYCCCTKRAAPKNFSQQMSNLQAKLSAKDDNIADVKKEIKDLQKEAKATKDSKILKCAVGGGREAFMFC